MTQRVKVDKFLNLGRQPEENGSHDVRKVSRQSLDVIARLILRNNAHPVVLGSLDQVVDLRVYKFENTLLRRFLRTPELFRRGQCDRA